MKYGYKFYDCSIDEFFKFDYKNKNSSIQFTFKTFNNIDHAINLIGHYFIPKENELLAETNWYLLDNNQLLIKEVSFKDNDSAEKYQEAIDRAWALDGHLDPRTVQYFYD